MLYTIVSHQRGLPSGAPRPTPVEEGVLLPFQVQGLNCPSDQDYLSTLLIQPQSSSWQGQSSPEARKGCAVGGILDVYFTAKSKSGVADRDNF